MDPDYRGFRASNPLKVSDLSGISHDRRTSRPGTEYSLSSRSSEFLAALEEFSSMKISKMEAQEKETKNCADETVEKFVQRRPSLSELAPADLAMGVSTPAHGGRRKSLPSLGLVAVDIQYSIPSKKNSRSYGCHENLGCDTAESKLYRINEIFKTESNPVHSKRKLTKSLDSLRVKGSSNVLPRRRFSVGAQGIKAPNSNIAFSTKQRRASCSTCNEKDSTKCRVSIHQRSLNIDDDDCDGYLYNPFLHRTLRNQRTSLPNINSNFAGQTGRSTILPKVGQRNSLVAKKLDEL